MSNWKEKMRRAEELASQQAREEQSSRQEIKEEREANIRHVFAILERLNVQGKLDEIRSDVWKSGEISWFEKEDTSNWPVIIRRKGVSLNYSWEEPVEDRSPKVVGYDKKFKMWDEEYGSSMTQDAGERTYVTGRRLNPHFEKVPIYQIGISYCIELRSFSFPVYVESKLATPSTGVRESIKLIVGNGSNSVVLASGPLFKMPDGEEEEAASFLDQKLLEDCLRRSKNYMLPADIELRLQQLPK